ncbi:DUF6166 domain-containing protein [Gemmata sp.]|uniref:DUF6166 domain-containing protein n=1 Tax=Gemmata sp. TaxID=1914242 RepID=UPI003F70FD8B
MKSYVGFRTNRDGNGRGDAVVNVIETDEPPRPLNPRLDLRSHSPTGFEWGYPGSGPAQFALALAADVLKDDDRALLIYQRLKFDLIAALPHEGWALTEPEVWAAILVTEEGADDVVGAFPR